MNKQLRPYQLEDINFLSQRSRAACFNAPRTGKTPTALKTFERQGHNKILIICPASAVFQWADEYEYWLNKPCVPINGTPKQKQELINNWTHGLSVSYDSFKSKSKSPGLIEPILKHNPQAVILDEAHRIKNTKTAAAKAAFQCRKIPYRLALTGTPTTNKQHEIFSILAWLYPETFSSYWKFIDFYFGFEMKDSPEGHSYPVISPLKPTRKMYLIKTLNNISTQRSRKEVMPWLPDKDYQQIRLPCTKEQLHYLNTLHEYYEVEHVICQGNLDRLVRYRQICLDPKLLDLKSKSPKTEWIKQYLKDYPNTPTLIFSKFTSFLKLLAKELKAPLFIGETSSQERNQLINDFQNNKIKTLLINIDAGREAITLDTAETAIFTDKYPPAGHIEQAEDRFISTDQSKAEKPHTIIELMMKDTYDEELYKQVKARLSETDIINNYQNYIIERS